MAITVASCAEKNPLLKEWKTPFGVPPFEEIKNEDYLPALKKAIDIHNKEIAAIVSCKEEPDFNNTILAFDRSGRALERINLVFGNGEAIAMYPLASDQMTDFRSICSGPGSAAMPLPARSSLPTTRPPTSSPTARSSST